MTSDEEVDYMSDAFLQSICGQKDVRPGLIKSHSLQYDHDRAVKKFKKDEKNRFNNPPLQQKEAESREDALRKPLDSDNVGFKMLQKLGFKPGSGLGKSGEGRVDPIGVEVKTDRQGLGRKTLLEEITKMQQKFRAEAQEKILNINDYRSRKAEEAAEKNASIDLAKSQRVCWELDTKDYIEEPVEIWFWPASKKPESEKEEESGEDEDDTNRENKNDKDIDNKQEETEDAACVDVDEFSVQEKLQMLTHYLHNTYLYCVWCGHTYDDLNDLKDGCPGPTRDDH